ncbi:GIY-YIG nuclease family protein [Patescibacteria group bacterium]|nr:GIY-YIG nuclease family protein [Patescibacteria group bacterium]
MENISPKTIKLFLLDGDPTGAKKVQLSNWSGMAFVIPRNKLEVVNKREELGRQCLYFLIGGTSVSPEVYVGEAENFQKRIPQHQSKDFWNICVVFLAKDENLSKAHVRFLEATFVDDCKKANRAKLHNGNSPEGSKLSEEDESDMNEFKQNIKLVLSTLGYTFHEIASVSDKTYEKYFIKAKGLEAKGIYTAEGMIVLEGSQVAKEETPSIHEYLHNLRSEKLQEQVISDKGDYFEVQQKITFSSLSTAAGFVMGRTANGWNEWKNAEGKTIDEIERKSLEKK